MPSIGQTIPPWVRRRVCLSCGFAGRSLQAHAARQCWSCPKCGADLYRRPPRSYAEMEGLDGPPEVPSRGEALGFVRLVAQPKSPGSPIQRGRVPRLKTLALGALVVVALTIVAAGATGL